MGYLASYLDRLRSRNNPALADAINKTVTDIVPEYISNFSYMHHVVSLLVGDVQGGKTSHMFGLMCAAADKGFMNFILLTTDNLLLQEQTYNRAKNDLCDFCICSENDYVKYKNNNLSKPSVIVLKKNAAILKKWKTNLESVKFCVGNPLFIVDDEADAASLNTLVNKEKQSSINRNLELIKKTASSSIYMQVTGTPQSIFLQTKDGGWKPYFVYYFKPGEGYIGGNFFFSQDNPKHVVLTDNEEASELIRDDEFPENGLKKALITHLITSAHLMLTGGTVCNFLVHPSVKTDQHSIFAEKIGSYLNEVTHSFEEEETINAFKEVYTKIKKNKSTIKEFEIIYNFIIHYLQNDSIKILTLNSVASYVDNTAYEKGINIIVGGNSLGRGVTIPQLQTVYYCRVAKQPQADTMWQHARMFGYDRDPDLMQVFMPPSLYKLFGDINRTNNSIIKQIEKFHNVSDIKIAYPSKLKPTRKNVIAKNAAGVYAGGVNYFPFYPVNLDVWKLDNLLHSFEDGEYKVALKLMVRLLEYMDSENKDDWNSKVFISFLNTLIAENPGAQGKLIVRRERDIGRGTGTLLSPIDRKLGDESNDVAVLTIYKITGNIDKGWDGTKIWIPNIKLPGEMVYYIGERGSTVAQ
ncbi:Z1 domain-containing protein [Varibaculum cambriense]|uniref:Z1 domain-containing protein n=1 Tax=Varibaculum cambriense TaxID=184870 RepID=UPI00290542DB|nr:Z1 domain-containing protein [Varibaculum cambriense]MDU1224681.1 Z1 domain-containing protein [Varibaculum cambriense]